MTWFVARFDFRAPGADLAVRRELYARAVEQAAFADGHGQDVLSLPGHHGADDGYRPSPLVVAAGMAAVTRRVSIAVMALQVNLHDPVRLAEDVVVLDWSRCRRPVRSSSSAPMTPTGSGRGTGATCSPTPPSPTRGTATCRR